MSGFFGIVREDGQHVSERLLEEVAEALRVRGPDGVSIWREGGLGGCFAKMRTGPVRQAEEMPLGIGGRFRWWGDIRVDGRQEQRAQLAERGCDVSRRQRSLG